MKKNKHLKLTSLKKMMIPGYPDLNILKKFYIFVCKINDDAPVNCQRQRMSQKLLKINSKKEIRQK